MAWQPPTEWEQYINGFDSSLAPPVDLSVPPVEQFALPGELAKHGDVNAPPPPPPPPPQTIAAPGVPVQGEVPAGALPPDAPPQEQPPQLTAPEQLQTPPMLHADAISGGYTPEQIAQAQGTLDVHGEDTRPLLGEPMGGEDLGKFLSTLPVEQQEEFRRKTEEGRQKVADAGKLEADTQRLRDAEDSARIYQESVQQAQQRATELDSEAKQLADENPLDSISGGRKIMGVLASIVGGFMANKTGRNMGLEAVDQIANDAMQLHAQKLQLNARQQAGIGDQIQRAGDVQKASEAVRLAVYDGAIKQLETQVQQFDPRGTTALRVLDDINALKQRRADAMQKYLLGEQKRIEDQRKYELDAMKAKGQYAKDMADAQKTGLESQKLAGQLGGGGVAKPVKPGDVVQPPEYFQQVYGKAPPLAMSQNQYEEWAKTGKVVEDYSKVQRENSPEERARQLSVGEINDEDGKPILFRDPGVADKVAVSKEATANAARLIDQLLVLRDHYGGWKSDLWKSPEWRRMRSDFADLQLEKKDQAGLGVLAGPDMGLINSTFGTSDPSEMRDPTPGLKRARMNMVEKFNEKLRAQAVGQKPKRYEPPDLTKVAAPEVTPDEADVKRILQFDPKRPTKEESPHPGFLHDEDAVPPSYKSTIDRLAAAFHNPDADPKEQQAAGALLQELQTNAHASRIRRYAQQAATRAAEESIRGTPEEVR